MRTWVRRIRAMGPWIAPVMTMALATIAGAGQATAQTPAPAAGQADPAKAQEVLTQLRAAIGGDRASAIKSFSAEGSQRITFGDREITNDLQLKAVLPDHFMRILQPELPNGMPGPRIATAVNGADVWNAPLDPMPNFGGGGRGPGGGGPGGGGGFGMLGGGPGGQPNPQQQARVRADLLRYMIGIFPGSDAMAGLTYSYVGTAQSNDGEADVLAVKGEGMDAKLFVDKKTHLPLMVTYMGRDLSRLRQQRPPQDAPSGDPAESAEARQKRLQEEGAKRREEMRKAMENAPLVENQLFYADYKKVDGVMLPHRFTRAVNGNAAEEVDIKKYKINPKIDLNDFQKKGS
jgi:hypothetical protein